VADPQLPAVSRAHLEALSNEIGVWQHAVGSVPNPAFGFCTDDVARALVVDVLHARELGWSLVAASGERSLRFLEDAFEPQSGRFRNFRAADGGWLDSGGSEDSHARAIYGLAVVMAEVRDPMLVGRAERLFARSLPAAGSLTALRPVAAAILACDAALESGPDREAWDVYRVLAARLRAAFDRAASAREWPWPEPVLTYENALLPRALVVGGARLKDERMIEVGCAVLDWLVEVQTSQDGTFSPIGNGWWPRGGSRSQFDQQPIEATATLLAAEAAYSATGLERYRGVAQMAYSWFLGDNLLGVRLADTSSGGCFDALTPRGVNDNKGAESTLMWLTALEHVRHFGSRR
jgi:hypothetical protein